MPQFKIKSQAIIGFATEDATEGRSVPILSKCPELFSENPVFHTLVLQIYNLFIAPTKFPAEFICRFLVVLHIDETADIYINDFEERHEVKVNHDVVAGQEVPINYLDDLRCVNFPAITILENDALVYSTRVGWRSGLYFNFSRNLDLDSIFIELSKIPRELYFHKHESDIQGSLTDKILHGGKLDAHLFTEGKTDAFLIRKAMRRLDVDLDLAISDYAKDEKVGGSKLLATCKHACKIPNQKKMIFVFDHDDANVLKELNRMTVSDKNFQYWGNNVYSFALPRPLHRNFISVTIEHYFSDDELSVADQNGRRLYRSDEFSISGRHKRFAVNCPAAPGIHKGCTETHAFKIIDDDVYDHAEKNVALSKSDFAKLIFEDGEGFDCFNFDHFNIIFDLIKEIKVYKPSVVLES